MSVVRFLQCTHYPGLGVIAGCVWVVIGSAKGGNAHLERESAGKNGGQEDGVPTDDGTKQWRVSHAIGCLDEGGLLVDGGGDLDSWLA